MSTKDAVLQALKSTQDDFVSGEALAARLSVSRTSIWKAIQSLERDGYCIAAVSNNGYRLIAPPDPVDGDAILRGLQTQGIGDCAVSAFQEVDSTMSEAKRREAAVSAFRTADGALTADGKTLHRLLIAAGKQTAGRGRLGRPFSSPANSGVYFTLIYAPKGGVTNPALVTAAAAVAVCRALEALYGIQAQIKWVNDIFAGGKKVCGILTEGFLSMESGRVEAANIGIGINVLPMGFTGDLAKLAGSLYEACGDSARATAVSRNALVARIVSELLALYDAWEADTGVDRTATADTGASDSNGTATARSRRACSAVSDMIREYKRRSLLIGKTVQVHPVAGVQGETYAATVRDIDDSAALIVQTADGQTRALHSGEVSLHSYDFAI